MRLRTLYTPAIGLALLTIASACSSSSSTTAATTTTVVSGLSNQQGGNLPSVSNATNLKVEPFPAAGGSTPPTNLLTHDLVVGMGTAAVITNTVEIQYVGANYADGKVFDSSWKTGQPTSFPLNSVIPGFAQGIVGMKIGGRREVVIPSALGYGANGSPPAVGPNETLVFVIDLLGVQ